MVREHSENASPVCTTKLKTVLMSEGRPGGKLDSTTDCAYTSSLKLTSGFVVAVVGMSLPGRMNVVHHVGRDFSLKYVRREDAVKTEALLLG